MSFATISVAGRKAAVLPAAFSFLAVPPEEKDTKKCTSHDRSRVLGFGRSEAQKAAAMGKKILTNERKNGIIKVQGGRIMSIHSIDSPIEQRNTAKGNPNAVLQFNRPLNNRQKKLLDALGSYDSRVIVSKKSVNMRDLSALTAYTGDEFALFTKGSNRLVIRGARDHVLI